MTQSEDPVAELIGLLARLPGIGERTAARLAFHVIGGEQGYGRALGESLASIHDRIHRCPLCGNFTAKDAPDATCIICRDQRRDDSLLCVVARVPDLLAIEKSGSYRGRYHVLHGLLAPLDGVGPDSLDLGRLERRIADEGVVEVIVATPLSVEGEATALFVAQVLANHRVEVTRIASGMPHGGELEYTDQVTLGRAFAGRRGMP